MATGDNAVILIQLDGTGGLSGVSTLTLGAGSGGGTIKGLDVTNFSGNGIVVDSNGNSIFGNFVGVDPTGTTAMPNGTAPMTGAPTSGDGIQLVNASNNFIGSTNPADRNVVSGNFLDGIHVEGTLTAPSTGNLIQGNFVSIAADGKSSVGNRTAAAPAPGTAEGNNLFGIEISGGNLNTVGGSVAGARNVVGFNGAGIEVDNGGQQNIIQGNYSGVGADGVTPVGNLLHGIVLRSTGNLTAPLGPSQPNEPGVSYNLVGGTAAGDGNLVEFNGTGGIAVFGNPVSASGQPNVGNAIEGNSVYLNGRSNPSTLLGIDLTNSFVFAKDDGLTPNDSKGHGAPNDPNNFQNFPVLTSAVEDGTGKTDVTGTLTQSISPNTTFRIEFFASAPDPLGAAPEGQQFLGFVNATTNASGVAKFSAALNMPVANGMIITATATDPIGNTSEFSAGITLPTVSSVSSGSVGLAPPPSVSLAFGPFGSVIEVVSSTGVLRQFDAAGVHAVATGVASSSVAFGPQGEVLLVTYSNGNLYQFDAFGGRLLSTGVHSASVTVGPFGEVLLVSYTNGNLYQFDAFGGRLVSRGVASASVAFSPLFGQILDVVYQNGNLYQYDSTGGRLLGGGVDSASVAFDASGSEVLDIIFAGGELSSFDRFGRHNIGNVG